jgi:hypothetical protein
MSVILDIKNVYGNELIYPVCETSKELLKLTGKKTFNRTDINILKNLGYQITLKSKEI